MKNNWTVLGDGKKKEKRNIPRFPYRYLLFRFDTGDKSSFQIKDLSVGGMRIGLKEGVHNCLPEQQVQGKICWQKKEVEIKGIIRWATATDMGLEFTADTQKAVTEFFSLEHMAKDLRPLHKFEDLEIPPKLKCWLSGNCPVDFFLWSHSDGAVASFQVVIFDHVVEWSDGQGLRTGNIADRQDMETPLSIEDILFLEFDKNVEENKLKQALTLINSLESTLLEEEIKQFIELKLRKSKS